MKSKFYRGAFILGALGMLVSVPVLNARPSPAGNVLDSIAHAKEAVEHGKQGHAYVLATHAEKSRNHAERGGKNGGGGFPGMPGGFPGMPGGFPGMPGGFPGMPGGFPGMLAGYDPQSFLSGMNRPKTGGAAKPKDKRKSERDARKKNRKK